MHLFIELITLLFFLITVAHGLRRWRTTGLWFFAALFFLGFARENFVVLRDYLYGFAPLSLMLGKAPMIASIIWGYTIYIAVCWAEAMSGHLLVDEEGRVRQPSTTFLAWVALFMIATVGFYEPFLELIGMARWEEGTRATSGIPWIALIGYPSLAVPFLALWSLASRRFPSPSVRLLAYALLLTPLAVLHAGGLQKLKDLLGW